MRYTSPIGRDQYRGTSPKISTQLWMRRSDSSCCARRCWATSTKVNPDDPNYWRISLSLSLSLSLSVSLVWWVVRNNSCKICHAGVLDSKSVGVSRQIIQSNLPCSQRKRVQYRYKLSSRLLESAMKATLLNEWEISKQDVERRVAFRRADAF